MRATGAVPSLVVGIVVVSLLWARPSHAYVDPGTGSFVLALVVSVVAGAVYAFKLYWRELKSRIRRLFSRSADD